MAYVNTYANTTQTMRKRYANDAQRTRIRNAKTAHMFVLCGACVVFVLFFNVLFARCLRHRLCQAQNKALFLQNKGLAYISCAHM